MPISRDSVEAGDMDYRNLLKDIIGKMIVNNCYFSKENSLTI